MTGPYRSHRTQAEIDAGSWGDPPPGFREYALAHKVVDTRLHFRIGQERFRTWCGMLGITEAIATRDKVATLRFAMPADFAEHAATETAKALMARYGVGQSVVQRWRRESGVRAQKPSRAEVKVRPEKPASKVRPARFRGTREAMRPVLDPSQAGEAQRYLQRFGPCFKASVLDPKRSGYVVAGRHMATPEMVALAESRGFDPNAWARL